MLSYLKCSYHCAVWWAVSHGWLTHVHQVTGWAEAPPGDAAWPFSWPSSTHPAKQPKQRPKPLMYQNVPVERVSTQNGNLNVTCLSHKIFQNDCKLEKKNINTNKYKTGDFGFTARYENQSIPFDYTRFSLCCYATVSKQRWCAPSTGLIWHCRYKKRGFWNYVIFVFSEIPVRKWTV